MQISQKFRWYQIHWRTIGFVLLAATVLWVLNVVYSHEGTYDDGTYIYSGEFFGFPIGYSFSGGLPEPKVRPPLKSITLPDGSTAVQGAGFACGSCSGTFEGLFLENLVANIAILCLVGWWTERHVRRSHASRVVSFQIHLRTALWLFLATSILLGANLHTRCGIAEPNGNYWIKLWGFPGIIYTYYHGSEGDISGFHAEGLALNLYVAALVLIGIIYFSARRIVASLRPIPSAMDEPASHQIKGDALDGRSEASTPAA